MRRLPRWSKILLAWAAAVTALIPMSPFRSLIACHLFVIFDPMKESDGVPPLWVDAVGDVPMDAEQALAIAFARRNETHGRSYWEMMRRYPDSPALCAAALQYSLKDAGAPGYYRRPGMLSSAEIDRLGTRPPRMALGETPEIARLDAAVSAGKRLEPQNAFFDLFEAYLCYGKMRDLDAIACIHRASLKSDYDSHSSELALAHSRYGAKLAPPLNFLMPLGRMQLAMAVDQRYLTSIRSFLRSIVGGGASDPGRRGGAVRLAADVVRLGGTMRDRSHSLIECLVGGAVQGAATHNLYLGLIGRKPGGDARRSLVRRVSAIRAVARNELPGREWDLMRRDVDRTEEMMPWCRAYSRRIGTWSDLDAVFGSMFVIRIASRLAKSLAMLLFVWMLAGFIVRRRGHSATSPLGPSPLMLWLSIAVASTPVRRPGLTLPHGLQWLGWWTAVAVGVATTGIVMCLLVSILRLRIQEGVGPFDTYMLRVRKACAYCIPGVLGFYVLTMLIAVPIASRANRQVDRWISDEMSIVWAEKPTLRDSAGPGTRWPDPSFPIHLSGLQRL